MTTFLKNLQSFPLPGRCAQLKAAHPYRETLEKADIVSKNPRFASTMVLLLEVDNKLCFPLVEREQYPGEHSGQIGLPGGKQEPSDISPWQTALRETGEELGLDTGHIRLIRPLSGLYIPVSNFWVDVFLGRWDSPVFPCFEKDSREVREIFCVDISTLMNEDNFRCVPMDIHGHEDVPVPSFVFGDKVVWGATAMILSEVKQLMKNSLPL